MISFPLVSFLPLSGSDSLFELLPIKGLACAEDESDAAELVRISLRGSLAADFQVPFQEGGEVIPMVPTIKRTIKARPDSAKIVLRSVRNKIGVACIRGSR